MHRRTLERHLQPGRHQVRCHQGRCPLCPRRRNCWRSRPCRSATSALRSSYGSHSSFVHAFRRWAATTPTLWRRNSLAKHGRSDARCTREPNPIAPCGRRNAGGPCSGWCRSPCRNPARYLQGILRHIAHDGRRTACRRHRRASSSILPMLPSRAAMPRPSARPAQVCSAPGSADRPRARPIPSSISACGPMTGGRLRRLLPNAATTATRCGIRCCGRRRRAMFCFSTRPDLRPRAGRATCCISTKGAHPQRRRCHA